MCDLGDSVPSRTSERQLFRVEKVFLTQRLYLDNCELWLFMLRYYEFTHLGIHALASLYQSSSQSVLSFNMAFSSDAVGFSGISN